MQHRSTPTSTPLRTTTCAFAKPCFDRDATTDSAPQVLEVSAVLKDLFSSSGSCSPATATSSSPAIKFSFSPSLLRSNMFSSSPRRGAASVSRSLPADDEDSRHPCAKHRVIPHRSNWTTHLTPGWHYGLSENGNNNYNISLEWLTRVFDPQTRVIANGKPRMPMSDGFGTLYILARYSSHTASTTSSHEDKALGVEQDVLGFFP
jgi:hypothetical protein